MRYCRTSAKGGRPLTFAIASKQSRDVTLSACPSFQVSGEGEGITAKALWERMKTVCWFQYSIA